MNNKNSLECACKYIFFSTLLIIILVNLINISAPILEQHGFRQTQTAISSYYLKENGFMLGYETPVIGEPWAVPFEFPIYQGIVAFISQALTIDLAPIGRIVSLFFAIITCIPILLILKKFHVSSEAAYFSLAIYLSFPVYLFWSGTFMIESTALFFTLMYLYYFSKIYNNEITNKNLFFLSLFLLLALLQKATTPLPGFIISVIAIAIINIKSRDLKILSANSIKIAVSLLVPLVIAISWIKYTDYLKIQNPIGFFLTSKSLSSWNYGTFSQRFSLDLWYGVILRRNFNLAYIFLFAFLFLVKNKNIKIFTIILLLFYFLPYLIFTNLHIIHNYYQSSNVIFLSIALGISTIYFFEKYLYKYKKLRILLLVLIILSNYAVFFKQFYIYKFSKINSENNRTLMISEYIEKNTVPNAHIVIYGYDWSSELAYYSKRKSLTIPPWAGIDFQAIDNIEYFLKSTKPSAYVLCPTSNYELILNKLEKKYPNSKMTRIVDCNVYLID